MNTRESLNLLIRHLHLINLNISVMKNKKVNNWIWITHVLEQSLVKSFTITIKKTIPKNLYLLLLISLFSRKRH